MGIFREFPFMNYSDYNLDWIISNVKNVLAEVEEFKEWKETHENQYAELKQLHDDIISGHFPPSITYAFNRWMRENALELVGELVKAVYFGLTPDGHFVAYIPESWDDIYFNTTGLDIVVPYMEYGRLVLSY